MWTCGSGILPDRSLLGSLRSVTPPNEKTTAEQQAKDKPPPVEEQKGEQTFRVDELVTYAPALGSTVGDIAGAFDGVPGSTQVTLAEAKKRIALWSKSEVQVDPATLPEQED